MTSDNDAIKSTVQSLQYVCTIVLALSLGETFKLFVADIEQKILSDRIINLIAFLFPVFPFRKLTVLIFINITQLRGRLNCNFQENRIYKMTRKSAKQRE